MALDLQTSTIALASGVNVNSSTQAILAEAKSRSYLFIQNVGSSNDLRLDFGKAASNASGALIQAGDAFELRKVPYDEINLYSFAGTDVYVAVA